jgi:hypothetical protein
MQIRNPLVRSVKCIAIEFDREATIAHSLYNKVDPEPSNCHLRLDAEAEAE